MLKKNILKNSSGSDRISLIIFLVILLILFILTLYLFFRNQINYKETIINQWRQQLQTTTNITVNNLENFIDKYSENLIVVAKDPVIKAKSCDRLSPYIDQGYCPLFNLYIVHKRDINAILLLDKDGYIKVHFPAIEQYNGNKRTLCAHDIKNEKLLKENEVCISNVFYNKNNQPAITISTPVYNKDSFSGVVRWMITTSKISARFIDSISIGDNGYIWTIDGNFNILSHHKKDLINKNLISVCRESMKTNLCKVNTNQFNKYCRETNDFLEKLKNQDEGYGSYLDFSDNSYSLAVFKKIIIGKNKWTLVTSIPYDEITRPIIRNAVKNYMTSGLVLLIMIIVSFLFYNIQKKKAKLEIEAKYLSEIAHSAEELQKERQKRLNAVIDGQEIERARISREMHDGLGQDLLALKMKLAEIPDSHTEIVKDFLDDLNQSLIKTIDEAKRISNDLMPVILEELGILTAIGNICKEISETKKINVDFVTYGISGQLDNKTQTYLYRICQEGLSNIVRHSGAKEANIQLLGSKEQITLIIQDDGLGFDLDTLKIKGNGLNNIKDRVSILNGILDIQSAIGKGTVLNIKIPL